MFAALALYISFKTCDEIASEQYFLPATKNTIYQYCYDSVILWIRFQSVVSSLLHTNSTIDVFFSKEPFSSYKSYYACQKPAVILHQLLIIWPIIL